MLEYAGTPEAGTFYVRAEFDGPAISDEQANLLIESNGGEVVYIGPCGACGKQIVGGKFPGRFGAEKAVKALEGLGSEAELYPAEDDEPESTTLVVEYDPGQGVWIPQELVVLATFHLCWGWQHDVGGHDAIIFSCRSPEAARYLKWKIDTGPLDRWVNAWFLPDDESEDEPEEESEPAPAGNTGEDDALWRFLEKTDLSTERICPGACSCPPQHVKV